MKKIISILIAIFWASVSLFPQSVNQIKDEINQSASEMKSLQCDFIQVKHVKMLNHEMKSTGRMFYQQTNMLRWEYTSPYKYTFILNGSKVSLKKDERSDVIDVNQNKFFRDIARIMMNSVVGKSLSDEKDFKTEITIEKDEYVAILLPQRKDIKSMFERIILHFDKKNKVISSVELLEKNEDRTIITMTNIRINEQIHQTMFDIN